MSIFYLDFETRSEVDLKKCGVSVYARHPSTSVLCMAWAIDDGPVELWVPRHNAFRFEGLEHIDAFCAHNAAFEIAIWKSICVPIWGWDPIPSHKWRCTAARCAALALPRRLDAASVALGLSERKDSKGHRLMLRMSKPKNPTKKDPSRWDDDPEHYEMLYEYCRQDVVVERAIHHATEPLTDALQAEWLIDQQINENGVPVDVDTIEHAVRIRREYLAWADQEMGRITGGDATTAKQVAKITAWLIKQGLNVGTLQASDVKALLARADVQGDVRRVLLLRQVASLNSTAKYEALKLRADDDGRIRGAHLFHGAATGRWAGKGVQFQNVPRGNMKPGEIETAIQAMHLDDYGLFQMLYPRINSTLSSCLRSMVKAKEGNKLIVCDYSGIEARVLAWLARERHALEAFKAGLDIYKVMASKIYGVKYDEVNKNQRFLGKVAILGLGYGMGAEKFKATVENFGGEIDEETAKKVVGVFREANRNIKMFWYRLNDSAIRVIEQKKRIKYGNISMGLRRGYFKIELPSGRELSYYQPEVNEEDSLYGKRKQISYMGINSYNNQWERIRTYGGKITENIVQAVSRDLLMDAMMKMPKHFRIVFHVHDEIVVECEKDQGTLEEVRSIMCEIPDWAEGCPVNAEGFEAERYRK